MDRYDLREITVVITPADETFGLHTNVVVAKSGNGEWVKYSDHKAAMLEHQVNMNGLLERLQARVRELEGCMKALRGITRAMPYSDKVKQAQGVIDQSLKGTP